MNFLVNFVVAGLAKAVLVAFFMLSATSHAENGALQSNEAATRKNPDEFIDKYLGDIKEACRDKRDQVITLHGRKILCQRGKIGVSSNQDYTSRKYSIAYINSPGGDISHAMTLGREMFRNGTYAIIDGHCHSACGSYLLPSPKRIYITDGTVLSMHTAMPRTAKDFLFTRYPNEVRNALSSSQNGDPGKTLISLISEYDEFYRDFVIREMDFFKLISRDVAYAQRYREVVRTLSNRKNYRCKPSKGLHLIIGPDYLDEFGVKTIHSWFPADKAQYAKLLPSTSQTDALIFDFDDHPFWMRTEAWSVLRIA